MTNALVPLPDYWLPQPPMHRDADLCQMADAFLIAAIAHGPRSPVDYTLPLPKWQFLCYVAAQHGLALHGSQNPAIAKFEPRQPTDYTDFGAQNAVYAAADGIWPIFFAIVDRVKSPSISNACVSIEQPDGSLGLPYYFFSISRQAIDQQPYHDGMIYLLPSATFMRQPPIEAGPSRVHVAQLASFEPVVPLAKLVVTPDDFPFLAQMRSHDDARLGELAAAMQQGLPLPD